MKFFHSFKLQDDFVIYDKIEAISVNFFAFENDRNFHLAFSRDILVTQSNQHSVLICFLTKARPQ